MSDKDQQPEEMRPIPDGGLQEAMPSWLKRPPAWRSMPTAEQRHERALPEPDTSVIDPRTLVDVADLPQWLQSIAARGEIPIPEPDASVGHAVQQVQAASAGRSGDVPDVSPIEELKVTDEPVESLEPADDSAVEATPVDHETSTQTPELGLLTDERSTKPAQSTESSRNPLLVPAVIVLLGIVILAIGLAYYFL